MAYSKRVYISDLKLLYKVTEKKASSKVQTKRMLGTLAIAGSLVGQIPTVNVLADQTKIDSPQFQLTEQKNNLIRINNQNLISQSGNDTEDQPSTGDSTEPDGGTGSQPGTGGSTEPDGGTGSQPDTGGSTEPDGGTGNQPDTGGSTEPDGGTGNQPDTGGSTEPDGGTGSQPGTGGSTEPDGGTGSQPGTGGSTEPDGGTGNQPDTGDSTEPDGGTGNQPDTGGSTEPDGGTGNQPDTGDSTEPDGGTGSQPGTGGSTEPDGGTGSQPDTGDSTQPVDGKGNTAEDDTSVKPENGFENQSKSDEKKGVQNSNEEEINFSPVKDTKDFIEKIGKSARKIAKENDLYASVMIAQAILESGSGSSSLSRSPYYNLFGIKSFSAENSVNFETLEDDGTGKLSTTKSGFKIYNSYDESLLDYVKLLKEGLVNNPTFYSGAWKSKTNSYHEATRFLTGKYATDISYYKKLDSLIKVYELDKYDRDEDKEKASDLKSTVNISGYSKPLKNYIITSSFGMRGREFHRGIDLAAPSGTPIYASKEGVIVAAEYHNSWGNYVAIKHKDGYVTLYAHQTNYLVKVGEHVNRGELIGFVGSTGNSTGPHLHFEFLKNSSFSQSSLLDPISIVKN